MSGELKWTPGPWYIDRTLDQDAYVMKDRAPGIPFVIARMNTEPIPCDLGRANSALVCAAPDLYAALELCREHLIERGFPEDGHAIPIIDAALARARGENHTTTETQP